MKRFASIDFLRGIAIVVMLFLHMIGNFLDSKTLFIYIEDRALINFVVLVAFPFCGGLAGFFLLVSAIGNMVSMHNHLQAGRSVSSLVTKQVVGGILLLCFAFLCESTTGYLGALGNFFHKLHNPGAGKYAIPMFQRGFTVETIHTIAWCILINGLVQGYLSRNGAWRNIRYQVTQYAALAVFVVVMTQPVWQLAELYGGRYGYPWNLVTGEMVCRPYLLGASTTFADFLKGVFLAPLAAPMEPLFPYLSISFAGSIIGLVISQPAKNVPRNFPRKVLFIGLAMFIVGTVGLVCYIATIASRKGGFSDAVAVWRSLPFHRQWYNFPEVPESLAFPLAWLWQFLSLNGVAIMATMFAIRVAEFRGRGAFFGNNTAFIRRFGFIAFTNYNNQWYFWIAQFFMGALIAAAGAQNVAYIASLPGDPYNPYLKLDWGFTLLLVVIVFAMYHAIMLLWEKIGYLGSLEWCMLTIAHAILPTRKAPKSDEIRKRWWQKGMLNVEGAFYNVQWLNIVEDSEIDHANKADSKFALKVALIGLLSIVFMPATFVSLVLARDARETEGKNTHNQLARAVSIFGITLMIAATFALSLVTPAMLGLSL